MPSYFMNSLFMVVDNVDRFTIFSSLTHICLVSKSRRGSQITVLFPRLSYWCFFFPNMWLYSLRILTSFCTTFKFIPFRLMQTLLVFRLLIFSVKNFYIGFVIEEFHGDLNEVYRKPSPKPRHCIQNSFFFTVYCLTK